MSERDDNAFEDEMRRLGLHPAKTRVWLRIGSGLQPQLRDALRKSDVANDIDALLAFTRLSAGHQQKLAGYLDQGLVASLAAELIADGTLARLLDE